MSSSRTSPRLLLAVASAVSFAAIAGAASSACSSSTDDSGSGTPEAGLDASTPEVEPGPPADGDSSTPRTRAQCMMSCNAQHPASVAKYTAIDTCWAAHCQGPCVDETGLFDGGTDASDEAGGGDASDDSGDGGEAGVDMNDGGTPLCGTKEASGVDQSCDDCTQQNCCTEWAGCYNDADCNALQTCFNTCPP